MKAILGILLIVIGTLGGLALAAWLGGYIMLYGGIVGAIEAGIAQNWAALVGGVLKALFFEVGCSAGLASAIFVLPGVYLIDQFS